MELYILGSLLSLGYFLKEQGGGGGGGTIDKSERYGKKMYRGNTYDQEQYDRVENQVFDRASVKFDEAQNIYSSNTVGHYTPDVLFHKSQKHALVTNEEEEPFNAPPANNMPGAWNMNQDSYETLDDQFLVGGGGGGGSGGGGFDIQQQQQRQPHQAQQQKEPFFHNNMVPFFGSTIKQNVTANANESTLNMYTGQWDYSRKQKQEIAPMFAPEANIQNIYGDQEYLQKMNENMDRFIPSLMRTNEAPTEKVYVTPGLNMGYNETAAFGFHDPVRALPKTTNELRAKNKPKLTYDKPVVSGKNLTQHGTARPNQQKNRPELVVYNETGKRNYGAKAVVLGETQRPEFLLGSALRSVSKFFLGGAKGVENMQPKLQGGAVAATKRKQHVAAGGGAAYVAPGTAVVKKPQLLVPGATAKDTRRKQQTEKNGHKGYFTSVFKGQTLKTADPVRKTVKQTTEVNTHGGGKLNLKSAHLAATAHDPLDKPAYTLKDMVKVENYKGISNSTVKKISVWNPDEKAKTTVKQTTLVKDYVGGKNTAQNGGAYAVLKVEPKYTQRQDVLVENYTGGAGAAVAAAQDYDAAYAAETNALKEQVAAGRAPTQNSVKLAAGGDMQNVDVKRLDTDRKNPRDFQQDLPNSNVPFQVLPTANPYSITKEKNTVSNQSNIDRMQPDLLDAYRNNPYTQSLHSFVF